MTAETFSPGTKGIITNLVRKTYSAGAGRDVASMVTTSTWSALLRYPYI